MKLPRRRFLHLAAGAAAMPTLSRIAWAQAYPTRPVRFIVGFAPAGGSDIVARLIGQWLSERLGQTFIIENRPGAATNIATEAVVRAAPDGYTLLLAGPPNAINATLYGKLNFNFIRDIAPVAGIIRVPIVMEVNPSVPVKTVPEFIAYAKAQSGKINMASAGNGSTSHVAGELFKMMAGVNMVHVPYRGSTPALTDLLGGQGNAPHCFPRNAYAMRTFAMPASRDLDRGSAWEAVGAGSGRRQRRFWPFDFREQGGSHRRCPSRCPTAAPCWTGRLDPSDATAMVAP
jgi:tripartite-type tricarboxylate transporter receptor subunit TctC